MIREIFLFSAFAFILGCITNNNNVIHPSMVERSQSLKEIYKDSIYRVVIKEEGKEIGHGTGFKVDDWVFTAAHVCEVKDRVVTYNLENHKVDEEVKLVKIWDGHDICALEAPDDGAPSFTVSRPKIDDWGVLIGYPELPYLTVSFGKILAERDIGMPNDKPLEECKGNKLSIKEYRTFFGTQKVCVRTDSYMATKIETYGGSSGGPIINTNGEIIGISSLTSTQTYWASIVSSEYLDQFIDELEEEYKGY